MASKPFQFKQFCVADDRCAHKVGTDAVVLATWVDVGHSDRRVLDVGTGCGVIALMLAQRTSATTHVDAVEIAEADAAQAAENVARSPWQARVTVYRDALQDFKGTGPYDLLVTNPPFFVNSLLPPSPRRIRARHMSDLSFDSLVQHSQRLLAPHGRLALILPPAEAERFDDVALEQGMTCVRRTRFRTRPERRIERILMEWSAFGHTTHETEFVLHDEIGSRSDAFRKLTQDFYLTE